MVSFKGKAQYNIICLYSFKINKNAIVAINKITNIRCSPVVQVNCSFSV